MKFSKRKPFVVKDKKDEELLELMKMFEQYLEERQEDDSKWKGECFVFDYRSL